MSLTPSCAVLHCDDALTCHRCGQATQVVSKRFVVDNAYPCLAGVTSKVVGHFTHACNGCAEQWTTRKAEG